MYLKNVLKNILKRTLKNGEFTVENDYLRYHF